VAAILGELDERQRIVVEGLLAELSGRALDGRTGEGKETALPVRRGEWEIDGISPWLTARLADEPATDGAAAPGGPFALTPVALQALRAAAEPLRALQPAVLPVADLPEPRRSLFGHIHGAFLRGRR
jgi:hypothetical protein